MKKLSGFFFHVAALSAFFFSYPAFTEDWQKSCQNSSCYAIVDAGSSGSRFYIYSENFQALWSKKITPGLSQISPDKVEEYLQNLVPKSQLLQMPTYFYGTAGMRLISEDEQARRYAAVKQWFLNFPAWDVKDIRTILGKEEGFFAWLAANLNQNQLKGVLEVGGASYQVNIPLTEQEAQNLSPEDVVQFSNHGQPVYVWSKSYLGLGINEVEKKMASEPTCFSLNYPLKNGQVANGDISQCILSLESQPELSLIQQLSPIQTILKTQKSLEWITLGAIKYSMSSPPFQFNQHTFNMKAVRHFADEDSCHQSWGQLIEKYTDPFLYRQCLAASYFYASIVDGMGVNDDMMLTYPNDQQNIDWTVGALVYQQHV